MPHGIGTHNKSALQFCYSTEVSGRGSPGTQGQMESLGGFWEEVSSERLCRQTGDRGGGDQSPLWEHKPQPLFFVSCMWTSSAWRRLE